jgi:hypothetical protein
MDIKKSYLIFAFCSVAAIGLLYGVAPDWFARTFIGGQMLDVNAAHIFRAVMGLYLALGCFWLYAAFDARHRNSAVLTTAFFAEAFLRADCSALYWTDGRRRFWSSTRYLSSACCPSQSGFLGAPIDALRPRLGFQLSRQGGAESIINLG